MRRALPILVSALALSSTAPPARAATVSVQSAYGDRYSGGSSYVVVEAGAGERNAVTVQGDDREVRVRDGGAAVSPGPGCRALAPSEVACDPFPGEELVYVSVEAGDGDDVVDTSGYTYGGSSISGGTGADRLRTGASDVDSMDGGSGDDVLDGGRGPDTVSYRSRTRPLEVDLATGSGGEPGERDRLINVAIVLGGSGADVMRGSPRADGLVGGPGRDRLVGRGGDDVLDGSRGADHLDGGPGDDRLNAVPFGFGPSAGVPPADPSPDRLRCGRGRDAIVGFSAGDVLEVGCETLDEVVRTVDGLRLVSAITDLRAPVVYAKGFCFAGARRGRIVARLQAGGHVIGEAQGRCPRRGDRRAIVRLNRRGRELLLARRGRPLRAHLTAGTVDADGPNLQSIPVELALSR